MKIWLRVGMVPPWTRFGPNLAGRTIHWRIPPPPETATFARRRHSIGAMSFLTDLKFALRSLSRAKGLSLTVVLTLALGIGANAAIFSIVRGVLLKPLVNRDENRLIYIRQSAPGLKADNTAFSVPEIQDLKAGL